MESESNNLKIEKLNDTNFHLWKVKMRMILSIKELDEFIDSKKIPSPNDNAYIEWNRKDKKARAFIGLSLSNRHFEQVQHAATASEMWNQVCNIYEKQTLLNRLSARRRFYSATMDETEKLLEFAGRIRQYASTLKSMGVDVEDQDMAMTMLSGLPTRFDMLISALDAISDDNTKFTFDFVVSRAQQEELRHLERLNQSVTKNDNAALLATRQKSKGDCIHCGRHNNSSKCWRKYPELAPEGHPLKRKHKALLAELAAEEAAKSTDTENIVCLLACNSHSATIVMEDKATNTRNQSWILDSGCTTHLTYDRNVFKTYTEVTPRPLDLAGRSTAMIVGYGDVPHTLLVRGKPKTCLIRNVQHVPELRYQLLSISVMAKQGIQTIFDESGARLVGNSGKELVGTGHLNRKGLYELDSGIPTKPSDETALLASLQLWHERLGHVSPAGILKMAEAGVASGLRISSETIETCNGCILGKGHRSSIPKEASKWSTSLLQLVHSDLMGPFEVMSAGGSRYIMTFIDDFSKWTVAYALKQKSDALECLKLFKAMAEKHTNKKITNLHVVVRNRTADDSSENKSLKILRSDNGGEYISNNFKTYLKEQGIKHELTVPYTPQQNGIAERMNRTLMDLTRSMLHHRSVPEHFWAEAISTAVYIRNRITCRSLSPKTTPYHFWHGRAPDLSHLRVFGSVCWYVVPKRYLRKLNPRARRGIMMGYPSQSTGYKIWDVEREKFVVSRDVYFNETNTNRENVEFEIPSNQSITNENGTECDMPETDVIKDRQEEPTPDQQDTEGPSESTGGQPLLRRSTRKRNPPKEWWLGSSHTNTDTHASSESALIVMEDTPQSYSEATSAANIDFWMPGITKEQQSIEENKTFSLVQRKPGMDVIPCKYVFKVKNGGPKVRIVAKGFRQKYGVNYFDTYSPVVGFATVRCFFAYVAHLNLECDQMDVVTAFLNGELNETVYMEVPSGFANEGTNDKVCLLHKAIYGLKQAPKQWFAKINSFLVEDMKFKSCYQEPCLYVRHRSSEVLIIVLYVDDLLIAGNSRFSIDSVKKEFSANFKMKDLGEATEFLGIEISRDREKRTLQIGQTQYLCKVLERFGMYESKSCTTPMASETSITKESIEPLSEATPYREAIGCLMYLMVCTRPDISFAVGKLCQYVEQPRVEHWTYVKRVFRYLSGTRNMLLSYKGATEKLDVHGYCDSDWGSCLQSRKSTSGFVFLFGGGAVSWECKKQTVVATSSSEAEYIAAFNGAREAIWISAVISHLMGIPEPTPVVLNIDNQGAIKMAEKSSMSKRNKHIDIRYHYVQSVVENKKISLQYIPTRLQLADSFTKPLPRVLFQEHRESIGICNLYLSSTAS